jgi:hypothetical protein
MTQKRPRGRVPQIYGQTLHEKLRPPASLSGPAKAYWENVTDAFDVGWFDMADAQPLRRYCELLVLRDQWMAAAEGVSPFSTDGVRAASALSKAEAGLLALERALRVAKSARTEKSTAKNSTKPPAQQFDDDFERLLGGAE